MEYRTDAPYMALCTRATSGAARGLPLPAWTSRTRHDGLYTLSVPYPPIR